MDKVKYAKEVGMVAAIMSDVILKKLYKEMQDFHGQGYMGTVDTIGDWAISFVDRHKDTKWEDILMNNALKPLSKELEKIEIICWDDAVMDFSHYMFEQFKK